MHLCIMGINNKMFNTGLTEQLSSKVLFSLSLQHRHILLTLFLRGAGGDSRRIFMMWSCFGSHCQDLCTGHEAFVYCVHPVYKESPVTGLKR